MTLHALWNCGLPWAADAELARSDLNDWLDDYEELVRLENELDSPSDRIPDMTRWYRMRQDAIRQICERWGAR